MSGVISGLLRFTADKDYKNAAGKTLVKAGETVVIIPQTMASAVVMANGKTLTQALASLEDSVSGHSHADYETALAGYQTQLTRLANRLTGAGF